MEKITIESAIKRGKWLLYWVPIVVFLGTLSILAYFIIFVLATEKVWLYILSALSMLLLPIFFALAGYLILLPRWRIWAFSSVRNVHEMKYRAILAQIYPKDGSFIWRLEIKNSKQKQLIQSLEQKFTLQDVFEDDYSIPFETTYSYSKILSYFYLFYTVAGIAGIVICLFQSQYLFSVLLGVSSCVMGSMAYKRISISKPVLTLSNDGITTVEDGFFAWNNIENEHIYWLSAGQLSHYGLSFEANGKTIKLNLKELTGLSSYKIDPVLRTYRGRYELSKNRSTYNRS